MKRLLILALVAVCSTVAFSQDIIKEQPEGEIECRYRLADIYYVSGDYAFRSHVDAGAAYVVNGTDGNVYIQNPLSSFGAGSWVKATKRGENQLVVALPAMIFDGTIEDFNGQETQVEWQMKMLRLNDAGNAYEADDSQQELVLQIEPDGTIAMQADDVVGLVDKQTNEWTGFADLGARFETINEYQPSLPDDIEERTEQCFINYNYGQFTRMAQPAKAAFYDDRVFVLMETASSQYWIEGKVEGTKVIIPANEYLGFDKNYWQSHIFLTSASYETLMDDGVQYNKYTLTGEDIVFDYDAATKTMTTEQAMLINTGKYQVEYLTEYCEMELKPLTQVIERPQDPAISYFRPYYEQDDWGMVEFQQAPMTASGEYLPLENIYFNVWFDDQLMTFDPKEYINLTNPMTDFPYLFTDIQANEDEGIYPDFEIYGMGQAFYYYRNNVSRIGVQTYTIGNNGERLRSNIVYTDGSVVSNINHTTIDNNQPDAIYDLQGRQVAAPRQGLYIVRKGNRISKRSF